MINFMFSFIVIVASQILFILGVNAFFLFLFFYCFILILYFPRYLLSPASVIFAYYGLWFLIAPFFASSYSWDRIDLFEYQISYMLIMVTFFTCIIAVSSGMNAHFKTNICIDFKNMKLSNARLILILLYIFCTLMLLLIVVNSGGINHWIANAGDAFLNRGGTGVYVVLSHYSGFLLAIISGYISYTRKKYGYVFLFIIWLAITSPIHGSKFQIGLFLIMALVPWLFFTRAFSFRTVIFSMALSFLFVYGMILRTEGDINFDRVVSYLNYFSTLHNLALLVKDFDLSFMETWFLPFNKFLTPFGLTSNVQYYDMNHYLTDMYYPKAWEIRATEQWPVEADLYLNFYFFLGLPVLFFYFYTIGFFYKVAISSRSLGFVVFSTLLSVYIVSHLRGNLYNHTDFYLYPVMITFLLIFRKYRL